MIDEFAYKIYETVSSWYNPLQRVESRHKYINQIADDFSDFIFGDESEKSSILHKQELLALKEREKIPEEVGQSEIVDMHYVYNAAQETTVMIALMQDGVIASFEIETNYRPVARRPKSDAEALSESENKNEIEVPKTEREYKRRDKLEII